MRVWCARCVYERNGLPWKQVTRASVRVKGTSFCEECLRKQRTNVLITAGIIDRPATV